MKHLEALIEDGGNITIGPIGAAPCPAAAADAHNAIAMIVRKEGETLAALPRRLDPAVGRFYVHDEITDEINGPCLQCRASKCNRRTHTERP
jgi:hypothetical protein